MNDMEYNRKYRELRRKQEEAARQIIVCQQLKESLSHEEEQLASIVSHVIGVYEEIEKKWHKNAPESKSSFRWDMVLFSMRRMQAERNFILDDDFGEMREYIKKLSRKVEACEQQLQELRREYSEGMEEKHGESD